MKSCCLQCASCGFRESDNVLEWLLYGIPWASWEMSPSSGHCIPWRSSRQLGTRGSPFEAELREAGFPPNKNRKTGASEPAPKHTKCRAERIRRDAIQTRSAFKTKPMESRAAHAQASYSTGPAKKNSAEPEAKMKWHRNVSGQGPSDQTRPKSKPEKTKL